jgi:hypothetical protein
MLIGTTKLRDGSVFLDPSVVAFDLSGNERRLELIELFSIAARVAQGIQKHGSREDQLSP